MNWQQAWAATKAQPNMADSSAIKVFGSEASIECSRLLMEVLGARGIFDDHATNERQKELESGGATRDEKLWRALADASLLGVAVPEQHGGSGLGFTALGLLLQEVGRAVAKVPAYPALALGGLPLARFGSAAHKAALLPGIASGERIVTAAVEEYASSDPLAPATRAVRDGDGHRLTGVKTSVPAATLSTRRRRPTASRTRSSPSTACTCPRRRVSRRVETAPRHCAGSSSARWSHAA